ncbi:MAG: metal-dependent hydrolase [Lysobacteraceae bacterium]
MDSLTHIALGGSIAAVIVPAKWRRQALLAGAIFGSLPDIDVPILAAVASDPITRMTWHRGPAHALTVLVPLGVLLCFLLHRCWPPVREAPRIWFCALMLALLSHPLLDGLTIYGTQLWWPLSTPPTMWSTLFIIDPMVLLPVLVGAIAAWCWRERPRAKTWAASGLIVCLAYVGWSIAAKQLVDRDVDATLAGTALAHAPYFSAPTPFNTLLWRIVVMAPDGYLEGERSLVADHGPIHFRAYLSDRAALAEVAAQPDVARLAWFTNGFIKADVRGNELVLTDLRMGSEPDYFFNFAVAQRVGSQWRPIPSIHVASGLNRSDTLRQLEFVWQRIWIEPTHAGNEATR